MYVRTLAQEMYGPHRTYGYAFGGSGGGYRTLACAENTNAWDGVVLTFMATQAWPNSYAGRARGQRTLKRKFAQMEVGEPAEFKAVIETPPNAGSVVAAEWDFDATAAVKAGDVDRFPIVEQFTPAPRVTLTRLHTFTSPGTYFPALRAHSQRQGNAKTPYARVPNLGRVRVVVT